MRCRLSTRRSLTPDTAWRPLQDRVYIDALIYYAAAPPPSSYLPSPLVSVEQIEADLLLPLKAYPAPRGAFELLVRLGVWPAAHNLNPLRHYRSLPFTANQLERIRQLSIRIGFVPFAFPFPFPFAFALTCCDPRSKR